MIENETQHVSVPPTSGGYNSAKHPFQYPPPSVWLTQAAQTMMTYERTPWWHWRARRRILASAMSMIRMGSKAPMGYEQNFWVYHYLNEEVPCPPMTFN